MKRDIYTATMMAADHIEAHPELFRYVSVWIPNDCGTPGCALGWVGHFYGSNRHRVLEGVAEDMGLIDSGEFYVVLNKLRGCKDWQSNALICARALRLYAERYLTPPAKPAPDWQQMAERLSREPTISEVQP